MKESGTKLKQLIEGMEQELSEYRKFIEETENIGIVKFDPNEKNLAKCLRRNAAQLRSEYKTKEKELRKLKLSRAYS